MSHFWTFRKMFSDGFRELIMSEPNMDEKDKTLLYRKNHE